MIINNSCKGGGETDTRFKDLVERTLTEVNDNTITIIGTSAFNECNSLTTIDLPLVTSIGTSAFYSCVKLNALILRILDSICRLSNVNAFAGTPIASGTGYIYVPSALIEDYKVATNWSTFAAQFRALEDYTVDGTTTGELDPTKI